MWKDVSLQIPLPYPERLQRILASPVQERCILEKNNFRCYTARKTHHLHADWRIQFCHWYLDMLHKNEFFFNQIIWINVACVTSDRIFNRHKNHFHQQVSSFHEGRFGFNVWAVLLSNKIVIHEIYDPNFNSETYMRILEIHIVTFMDNVPLQESKKLHFQQNEVPAYKAAIIIKCLNTNFGQRWIGTISFIKWPARSPDITPLDYFGTPEK